MPAARGQTVEPVQELETLTVRAGATRSFTSNTVQVGTFRDQDPLDVPLTNNVVTREVLDAQGARTLFGALRNTAGVTRSQLSGSTYDNISIRGILVENRGNYRLNGSLPIINLIDVPLENKERVEVLKGASSLYYGLVPPSGIVNFVTKRAGSQPVTSVATSVNSHGAADVHVDIGRRFGTDQSMGLRVNAAAGKEDIGIDNYKGDRSLLSLAYDWRVAPAVSLKVDLEHYRKDVSEQASIGLFTREDTEDNPRTLVVPKVPGNTKNLAGDWQRYDAEATNLLLRTDISLSDAWILTLETGRAVTKRDRHYSSFQFNTAEDVATGDGTLAISFTDGQRFENTNHRVETVGQFTTGTLQHELTLGGTYNEREGELGDSGSATFAQNYYDPRPIPVLQPASWSWSGDSRIVDKGVYLFDRIRLGDRWQVLAGVRYSDYSNTTVRTTRTDRYSTTDTSPSLSVMFKPTPDVSVYASYLEGLEETGTAPANRANAGEVLPPAVNKQREVGVKARVMRSLFLQAAYFDIRRPQTTIDSANRFVIGGRSEYRGLELSASGEIGRQWSIIASALLLDAEIKRTSTPSEVGKTPENTPKRTFSLFGEYKMPAVPGWAVNAGVYHVGKRAVNNANDAYIGSYTIFSAGTRYSTKWNDTPVTLQANIDNLTDREYWSTAGNGLLGGGAPRTLRVAAKFDF